MSYFAPYIDATGLHIPVYSDILASLVASAQQIYGSDIYLGTDSQDYQFISAFAAMVNDSNQLLQAVYNARSPVTAIGSALDGVVAINGVPRPVATPSTASVVITGTAGTTITGGLIADANNYQWSIPSPTIIPSGGTITVTATCQTSGVISAPANTITVIVTPTSGWTSVTNPSAATVGTAVASDAQYRSLQAISTAQPSQSLTQGLQGALAGVTGVTRSAVYENDTPSTDSNGIPANSICVVVEGGSSQTIAQTIWSRKSIGCGTYGTTTVNVTDSYGVVTPINYFILAYQTIVASISIHQLTGYSSATTTAIQAAIASYVNGLPIGGTVYISGLWGAILSVNTNPASPIFSVTSVEASVSGGTLGTSDIPIAFNTAAQITTSNVTITFV